MYMIGILCTLQCEEVTSITCTSCIAIAGVLLAELTWLLTPDFAAIP